MRFRGNPVNYIPEIVLIVVGLCQNRFYGISLFSWSPVQSRAIAPFRGGEVAVSCISSGDTWHSLRSSWVIL